MALRVIEVILADEHGRDKIGEGQVALDDNGKLRPRGAQDGQPGPMSVLTVSCCRPWPSSRSPASTTFRLQM